METVKLIEFYPLVFDILDAYRAALQRGMDCVSAGDLIRQSYCQELQDEDERDIVWIALALAQAQATTQDKTAKQNALRAIQACLADHKLSADEKDAFEQARQLIESPAASPVKKTRKRAPYLPDWKIGDTFAHPLTHPLTTHVGLTGWYVLFRKIGEYIDSKHKTNQLGYLSLCPSDMLPKTEAEMAALGYLRVMYGMYGGRVGWEYLTQVSVQSKATERSLQLEFIGNFPAIAGPSDEAPLNPMIATPFFNGIDKETGCPRYEKSVCLMYKRNGILKVNKRPISCPGDS